MLLDLSGPRSKRRPQPPIPNTGWKPPEFLPDLSRVKSFAIDTETYDPGLLDYGPGWARGSGHIVGISVAVDDWQAYLPLRHEVEPHLNMPEERVREWLAPLLANERIHKICANAIYDVGWLMWEGYEIKGRLHDVQFCEALLTEDAPTSLEDLGRKYVGSGKETDTLYRWLKDAYGGKVNGKQRANIYRAPVSLVGPYAEEDAVLPLKVLKAQWPLMQNDELLKVYALECELIYLWVEMRMGGVRVDIDAAAQLREEMLRAEKEMSDALGGCNVNASADLAKLFDKNGIWYPHTAKGNPSFTKEFLRDCEHPIAEQVQRLRKYIKFRGSFVENAILESNVKGFVYPTFHPLRADEGGTRSGRLSCSTPNVQQIPTRDKEIAHKLRALFLPDNSDELWFAGDYSQIEYRMLAHFAVGPGANELRQSYVDDPEVDYHDKVYELVGNQLAWDLEDEATKKQNRPHIKTINFMLVFGGGKKKLIKTLGVSEEEGELLYNGYHTAAPYAKATMDYFAQEAEKTGKIRTILGQLSRFDKWVPRQYDPEAIPLSYREAVRVYGHDIRRHGLHKALNRKLQGSAAYVLKLGMAECRRQGINKILKPPKMTVHDEVSYSVPRTKEAEEAVKAWKEIMEKSMPDLRVPIVFEVGSGSNWGDAK